MNINIGNPLFLHNEIVLKNSQLYIRSTDLSRLLGIPHPQLLKAIRIINSKKGIQLKLIPKAKNQYLINQADAQVLIEYLQIKPQQAKPVRQKFEVAKFNHRINQTK